MRLSLRIEVLLFEDSEWSHGRYKMERQVEKLEHFRHILLLELKWRGESSGGGQKPLRPAWGQYHRREHGKKMVFSFEKG